MNQPQIIPKTTPASAIARRIEEASLNAWPAMQQTLLDGWVLRFSKGFTKRSNSIVPLYSACDESHVEDKIRYCENLYAREQLQTVFRIPSFLPDEMPQVGTLDGLLEKRGYQVQETSRVLCCNIPQPPDKPKPLAQAKFLALNEWLSVYCDLTGMAEPAQALHRIILNSIGGECGFLVLYHANQPVACGLGVLERELVGIFDIFTHEQARNQGFARCTVTSLMNWALERGAQQAYLQVVADNHKATTLYKSLGFQEIYNYWYRIAQ